jgi:hypothetical protein
VADHWDDEFDDAIQLPDGGQLVTLCDAGAPGQPSSVSPTGRTTSPPPHRAEPSQPKSIWQAIKDSVK